MLEPLIKEYEIKNEMVVLTTFMDDSKTKAVCNKEDVFDLRKGLRICIAKRFDENHILTPEGIEHQAETYLYYKDVVKEIERAIKKQAKVEKRAIQATIEVECQKAAHERYIMKKMAKRERKRQEQIQLIAEGIKLANS